MPPLDLLLNRLPDSAHIHAALASLGSAGFHTDRDLFIADDHVIVQRAKISPSTLKLIKARLAETLVVPHSLASDLAAEEESRAFCIPTGFLGLDQELDGGFQTGKIYEFVGGPATGKTQMALFVALSALCHLPDATVIYLDSGNSFSLDRFRQLFECSSSFNRFHEQGMTIERLVARFRCIPCHDAFELVSVLEAVYEACSCPPASSPSVPSRTSIGLLVIDSVASILSPMLDFQKDVQGHVLLQTTANMLRDLVQSGHMAAVTVNHIIHFGEDKALSNTMSESIDFRSALGTTWAFTPNYQLHFIGGTVLDSSETLSSRSETGGFENGSHSAPTQHRIRVIKRNLIQPVASPIFELFVGSDHGLFIQS
ncbi:P-loop containing nucleoside triphosphate hydrolase protein [Polychytrium aggregatum]|uniref:P-loop containing nucleoside triphosphate hydrolase protein n=1 Tax=Polychytrium aggregatum TaxID=110093 RepID=UPI0022FEDFEF|nr:P-loop containing nucleoside triphosphate hydrolase protein [Polychytrium aggregatum]KAI9205771.1 P-loop containing nucleoside triphosphate hydrolase protein [Polychytrium aggregatum]